MALHDTTELKAAPSCAVETEAMNFPKKSWIPRAFMKPFITSWFWTEIRSRIWPHSAPRGLSRRCRS